MHGYIVYRGLQVAETGGTEGVQGVQHCEGADHSGHYANTTQIDRQRKSQRGERNVTNLIIKKVVTVQYLQLHKWEIAFIYMLYIMIITCISNIFIIVVYTCISYRVTFEDCPLVEKIE